MRHQNFNMEFSDQEKNDDLCFEGWKRRIHELRAIANPIIDSALFKRLASISFLGVLSPHFSQYLDSPLCTVAKCSTSNPGSRGDHSLGVAVMLLDLTRQLGLSRKIQKYAVVYGLLHDIATWPLSHTGEAAFSKTTNTSSTSLREMMIQGSSCLPQMLTLNTALDEIDIQLTELLSLFKKDTAPINSDLHILWQIVRSPITPDSLEGIWRAGYAFQVDVPHPNQVQKAFSKNLFSVFIKKEQSEIVLRFWRKKSEIYTHFINRSDVIHWESSWSIALRRYFSNLNLVDSLLINEDELIAKVMEYGLPHSESVCRYKPPQLYQVYPPRKRVLKKDQSLLQLHITLAKVKKTEAK